MTITIEHRTVYGTDRYYPCCETAKLFARIAGGTTLTPAVIRLVRSLGFEVVYHERERP